MKSRSKCLGVYTSTAPSGRRPVEAGRGTDDGLPSNQIFRLFEDSRGDIWISMLGNPNAVLTRWERATETFHTYTPSDGIPEAAPTAFCEDAAGNIWIGSYQGGLLRYTRATSRHSLRRMACRPVWSKLSILIMPRGSGWRRTKVALRE